LIDIPEEIIAKIKRQKEEECAKGRQAAIEFAEGSEYWLIEKTMEQLGEDEIYLTDVSEALDKFDYDSRSSAWKDCFEVTLSQILRSTGS
jgi:hypothetical protein